MFSDAVKGLFTSLMFADIREKQGCNFQYQQLEDRKFYCHFINVNTPVIYRVKISLY